MGGEELPIFEVVAPIAPTAGSPQRVRQRSLRVLAVVLLAIAALGVAHIALVDTFRSEAPDNFRTLVIIVEVIFAGLLSAAVATYVLSVARERSRHAVIESLAETFSVPRSIEEIGQISVAQLVGSGVASAALLAVAKDDGQQLEAIAACGYPRHWQISTRPALAFIPHDTLVQQELNLIDPWLEPVEPQLGQQPWVARVPIFSGDEVLGLLLLINRNEGFLGDARLLRTVSTLIAAALDHAQLYEAAYGPPASTEDADLARHELLSAVAAELGPALVSVEALASVSTGDDDAPGTIEDARRLSALTRGIGRLNTVLSDVTALGSAEEFASPAPPAPADVGTALRAIKDAFAPAFEARRQTLSLDLPAEPLTALASADTIERLMLHLLSNANRAAPDGGSVVVRASNQGDTVRIEVEDSGNSVDPLEQGHIFEPFYRVARGAAEVPGAGIGLAVVRRLAESEGGAVWAEPRAGGGTSYHVGLPALVRAAPEAKLPLDPSGERGPGGEGPAATMTPPEESDDTDEGPSPAGPPREDDEDGGFRP